MKNYYFFLFVFAVFFVFHEACSKKESKRSDSARPEKKILHAFRKNSILLDRKADSIKRVPVSEKMNQYIISGIPLHLLKSKHTLKDSGNVFISPIKKINTQYF